MTESGKPKVFSLWENKRFVSRYNNVNLMAEADVFTRYIAFDVILPVVLAKEHLLNIFEETVLKFAGLNIYTPEKVAEFICFTSDLVQFIQHKLYTLGFLEKNHSITALGGMYLNELCQAKADVKNVCVKVFTDYSGKLLPYIHVGVIRYEDVDDWDKKEITVSFGSAGTSRTLKGSVVEPRGASNLIPPKVRDIVKNVIRFNRLCENRMEFNSIQIDPKYVTDVSSISEIVYIHNKLAIQKGNVDSVIVSDGFSLHIEKTAEFINRYYPQIINNLKQTAVNNSRKYEEKLNYVGRKYFEIEMYMINPSELGDTADARRVKSKDNNQKLADYYGALEWAMHYYLKSHPIDKVMMDRYKSQNAKDNADKIDAFAEEMKLDRNEKNKRLFGLTSSGIERFKRGNDAPEMNTVLPLCIIEAKYNPDGAFRSVVREFPEMITFLCELKPLRDSQSHVGGEKKDLSTEQIMDKYLKTLKIIKTILPDFENTETLTAGQTDDISQRLLNADVALADELGIEYYNRADDEVKYLLRQISPDKQAEELPHPGAFVLTVAKLLEHAMRTALLDLLYIKRDAANAAMKKTVGRIADMFGECPASLTNVREHFFINAMKGEISTLGAYTLAISALAQEDMQERKFKDLIGFVDKVLILRKHGNNAGLLLDNRNLTEIRGNTFETLKIIGGIL
jgi:hypothetical protein